MKDPYFKLYVNVFVDSFVEIGESLNGYDVVAFDDLGEL